MLRKKTFRTYEEQIDFLRNRGIAIEDEKEAIEALSTYSYYSLVNLNKHLYGGLTERQFIGNPSLLDLQLAHMLNMNFYQVILKGILYIEASFKTKLAYLISREYGVMSRENIAIARGQAPLPSVRAGRTIVFAPFFTRQPPTASVDFHP